MEKEKRERREKILEKRKIEKEKEEKRKIAQLKWNSDLAKAVNFDKKRILTNGLNLFRKMKNRKNVISDKIEKNRNLKLMKIVFISWKGNAKEAILDNSRRIEMFMNKWICKRLSEVLITHNDS